MKLLLDQGLPKTALALLRQSRIKAEHVAELGMAQAADDEILQYASANNLIVVTLDADFSTLLAMSGAPGPSTIRLRMQGLKGEALASWLITIADRFESELSSGVILTIDETRVRLRRLPIQPRRLL